MALAKAGEFAAAAAVSDKIDFTTEDVTRFRPAKSSYDPVCLVYLHLSWQNMPGVFRAAVKALEPSDAFVLLGHDERNLEHGFSGPPDPDLL